MVRPHRQIVDRWVIKRPASRMCTYSMPKLWWDRMLKAESWVVVAFLVVQMRLSVLWRTTVNSVEDPEPQ